MREVDVRACMCMWMGCVGGRAGRQVGRCVCWGEGEGECRLMGVWAWYDG